MEVSHDCNTKEEAENFIADYAKAVDNDREILPPQEDSK